MVVQGEAPSGRAAPLRAAFVQSRSSRMSGGDRKGATLECARGYACEAWARGRNLGYGRGQCGLARRRGNGCKERVSLKHLRIHLRIIFAVAAVVALATPVAAEAAQKGKGAPKVTVMTRNLFLGADLAPAIEAADIPTAIDAQARCGTSSRALSSRSGRRRSRGRSSARRRISSGFRRWRSGASRPSDGGAPPISPVPSAQPASDLEFDFLALLQAQLKKIGAKYRVVVVQKEFGGELPVDVDHSDATGTGPLAGFGADFDVSLTMRDVILVRRARR